MLNPYVWIAALVFALSSYATGRWQQYKHDEAATSAALLKATQQAREKEQEWQLIYKETTDAKESQLRAIAVERDRAIASLRNRPRDRLPETPANCAGASPAALSSSDAEAFVRLAASADDLRAHYADCKAKLEGG